MKLLKKCSILALLSFQMLFGTIGVAFAWPSVGGVAGPSGGITNESFKVNDYLTADGQKEGEKQGQKYLESKAPLASFIIQIINFLVLTIGSFCFLAIVVGGFVYVVSYGNETQINKAKEIIVYAIIGLIVVLGAYFITAFVQSLFYDV